jgi:hypothetical protein
MAELKNPETQVAKAYQRWRSMTITKRIMDLMYFLSNPDDCASKMIAVPGSGESAACTLLGYSTGRASTVTEMLTLDDDGADAMIEGEETFSEGEI